MPFTETQRYQTLTFLNEALLRTDQMRSQYSDYSGEFYRFDATLSPTEYQKNRPVPLLFQKDDIWERLDNIETESEILVTQFQAILTNLTTIETAIISERSSPNGALIRADVLEWQPGSRTSGMTTQRDDLIEKLRMRLGLPPTASDWGGGVLLRS